MIKVREEALGVIAGLLTVGSAAELFAFFNERGRPLGDDGSSGGIVIPPVFLPLLRRWNRDEEELDI